MDCGPTKVEQNVDLTDVEKITFLATSFPNSSDDPPGWVAVFIDGIHILDLPDVGEDDTEYEILLFGYSGTHLISFRTMGGEFGAFLAIGIVSAIAPDDVANFWAEPLIGSTPLVVHFHDISVDPLGNIATNWFWDFGDPGQTRYVYGQRNPIHIFEKPGTYTIVLTAYWSWGSSIKIRANYIVTTPGFDPLFTLNICTPE